MASLSIILIIGVATFFNFAVILHKVNKKQYMNAAIDFAVFISISLLFSGSISALSVGMIASFLFSVYLIFKKPKIEAFNIESSKTKTTRYIRRKRRI